MANTGNIVKYRVRKLIEGVEDSALDVRVSGIARKEDSLRSYLLSFYGQDITEQQALALSNSQVSENTTECPIQSNDNYPLINGLLFRDNEWTNSELVCNLVFDPVTGNPIEAESVPAYSFNQDLNANDPQVPNSSDLVFIDGQGTSVISTGWYKYVVNSTIYAVQFFGGVVVQKIACIVEPTPPPPTPPDPEEPSAFIIRTTQQFANAGDYLDISFDGSTSIGTIGGTNTFSNPTIIPDGNNNVFVTYVNSTSNSFSFILRIKLVADGSTITESILSFVPPSDNGIALVSFNATAGNSYYIDIEVI